MQTVPVIMNAAEVYERGGGVPGKKIVDGLYRAQDNLRLRETGGTSGEIITTMKADTYVIILSLGKEETIDGITDNWVEVETQFGSKNLEGDLTLRVIFFMRKQAGASVVT